MTKSELDLLRFNLHATIAYLSGDSEEPDDAPDQYIRAVSKALHTLEWLYGEMINIRSYNSILVAAVKNKEEVVRCRDCKHGYRCKNAAGEDCVECSNHYVSLESICRKPDWFCADGIAKDTDVPNK